MMNATVRFLPAIASALLMGCTAQAQVAAQNAPKTGTPTGFVQAAPTDATASDRATWHETGVASWYGGRHNGRRTSSGQTFDETLLTAAHTTLPLGTRVRVTMQDTGESVVVTINDRQPPKRVRVIDLSREAASRLGILRRGTAMVTLTKMPLGEPVEVADAPEGAVAPDMMSPEASIAGPATAGSSRRHGRRHTRHVARAAGAAHRCCHAPSVVQARRSVPHRAAQQTL